MKIMIHAFERVQEILGTDTYAFIQFQYELDKAFPLSPHEYALGLRFGEHGWQPQGGFGCRLALFFTDIGGFDERAELVVQAARDAKRIADEAREADRRLEQTRRQGA